MAQSLQRLSAAIKSGRSAAMLVHQGRDTVANRVVAPGVSALTLPQLLSELE
jgi:hypothetical protein